ELGVRAERAHARRARALLPARVSDVLRPPRRPLGARADARRRAALPPPRRDLRPRRAARLAPHAGGARAGVTHPRPAALVPAYDASATIAAVVQGAARVLAPVVVVDDGSHDDTAARARDAGAVVVRQEPNAGKGAALVRGFRVLAERGHTHALTL